MAQKSAVELHQKFTHDDHDGSYAFVWKSHNQRHLVFFNLKEIQPFSFPAGASLGVQVAMARLQRTLIGYTAASSAVAKAMQWQQALQLLDDHDAWCFSGG